MSDPCLDIMETDENKKSGNIRFSEDTENQTTGVAATPVNSLILNYYKKFGRKRDLEQYFSLSTAQSDIQDTNSSFWRQMKSQNESSDSGDRKTGSSNELCRISIKCRTIEPSTSQDDQPPRNSDSDSPPIITEKFDDPEKQSDNESLKSNDNHSQKSNNESHDGVHDESHDGAHNESLDGAHDESHDGPHDGTLDTSVNKPFSPTSSITSQRKLEWDSLADVGYGNESGRKTSGSSLSTLERLALKQQYSNNDTKGDMGLPTAHSTPFDVNYKPKTKRHSGKTTKIYRKDINVVEVNMPQDSKQSQPQAFNVNLTKHISFNVGKSGEICFNEPKTNTVPTRASVETEMTPLLKLDRESQTSLLKTKEMQHNKGDFACTCDHKPSLPLSLKTIRRNRRKKKLVRKKSKTNVKTNLKKENSPSKAKSVEQVSEAESFEYMPGHIYNQNQLRQEQEKSNNSNPVGNKSSLESSGGALTTDSSKDSKQSFTKDLDKSVKLLQHTLQGHSDYSNIKKKLIKEVVQRLLQSKYRGDDSSTDFLSGLSYSSQKLGIGKGHHTTSSTSDANTDGDFKKPRKSILRVDKFNPNDIASTSQSAPNLPIATSSEPILQNLIKPKIVTTTDTENSSKEKLSTDTVFVKTASDELYKQYLEALRRETQYKKHLKDKEQFLKQKLVGSDLALTPELRIQNRIKDLMKDLTRNNYDDGSGDASKLEGGSSSYIYPERNNVIRKQRSHSVFTLSSGQSDKNSNNNNLKKKLRNEISNSAGSSNNDNRSCKCVSRGINHRVDVSDSSVQVNLKIHGKKFVDIDKLKVTNLQTKQLEPITDSAKNIAHIVSDDQTGDIKYVCLCPSQSDKKNDLLIYKCSRLDTETSAAEQINNFDNDSQGYVCQPSTSKVNNNKDSEDDCRLILLQEKSSESSAVSIPEDANSNFFSSNTCYNVNIPQNNVTEATRCLQTEISINPKIPEAQLSDVVFLDDCDCATVIEPDKISPKYGDHNIAVNCGIADTSGKWFDKNLKTNDYERFSKVKEKIAIGLPKIEERDDISPKSNMKNPDNFTIPISGTNVSLVVSISNHNKKVSKEVSTQETSTPHPQVSDKGTCLPEECTKGVQSEQSRLFSQINQLPSYHTALSTDYTKLQHSQSNFSPTCCKFNTHPKTMQICEKTPLLRTNTDPGHMIYTQPNLYSVCSCRNYTNPNSFFVQKDVETQLGSTGVATQKSEAIVTTPQESPRHVQMHKTSDIKADPIDNCEVQKKSNVVNTQTDIREHSTHGRNSNKMHRDTDSARSTSTDATEELLKLRLGDIEQQIVTSSSSSNNEIKIKKNRSSSSSKKKDPILGMIKDITKRYSKENFDKTKKVKCFKEFISVLNYLVNTEDSPEAAESASTTLASPKKSKSTKSNSNINKTDKSIQLSSRTDKKQDSNNEDPKNEAPLLSSETSHKIQKLVDKAVQLSARKYNNKGVSAEISEEITSTDIPFTSSDSATCEVLNKIRKECEKYQQKRCKSSHHNRECSSSSSCDCKRSHHCPCKNHKGHKHKSSQEKVKKTCIAYNLILQTSDSMASEDVPDKKHVLKNIVVKVPPKRKNMENVPFREVADKFEKKLLPNGEMAARHRPGFVPNTRETSSDEFNRQYEYTVRDYLESNRPDFVENSAQRQNCLKVISERRSDHHRCPPPTRMIVVHTPNCMGNCCMHDCGGPTMNCLPCLNPFTNFQNEVKRIANECASKRQLLSMQLDRRQVLSELSDNDLRSLATHLGVNLRAKKDNPKFMSEKEMKKHSQKIYKSLPEVVKKKDDKKKENVKKTNLLMADIFKKLRSIDNWQCHVKYQIFMPVLINDLIFT